MTAPTEGGTVPDAPWHLLDVIGLVVLGALCAAVTVRLAASPQGAGGGDGA